MKYFKDKKIEFFYKKKKGKRLYHGRVKWFERENGVIVCKHQDYINGKKYGEGKEFRGGKLFKSYNYKKDKLHGKCFSYNENGTIYEEIDFCNGREHGKSITYSNDGFIYKSTEFHEGKRHGEYIVYDKTGLNGYTGIKGRMIARIEFKNGKQDGLEEHWDERIFKRILYRDGKKIKDLQEDIEEENKILDKSW